MTFSKTIAAAFVTLAIAGCAQQEEEIAMIEEEPIYAKDGTIIGMRPVVGSGSMSDDNDMGSLTDTPELEEGIPGLDASTDNDG